MSNLNKYEIGGLVLLGYVGTSIICLKKPSLLWQKKEFQNLFLKELQYYNGNKLINIAHRGGSVEGCENTIQAFKNAEKIGVKMFETDVIMTKDEQIVVFHDSDLVRLCDKQKFTKDALVKELQIQKKFQLDFMQDQHYEQQQTQNAPLLEDLFKEFPDKIINLELKNPTKDSMEKVSYLIRKYERSDDTIWGVKRRQDQDDLAWQLHETPQFLSIDESAKLVFFYLTGLLPFMKPAGECVQIPLYSDEYKVWQIQKWRQSYQNSINIKKQQQQNNNNNQKQQKNKWSVSSYLQNYIENNENVREWVIQRQANLMFGFIKLNQTLFSGIASHLKQRGYLIFTWVQNDESMYQKAIDLKVNGIMTDRPSHLQEYLLKQDKLFQ